MNQGVLKEVSWLLLLTGLFCVGQCRPAKGDRSLNTEVPGISLKICTAYSSQGDCRLWKGKKTKTEKSRESVLLEADLRERPYRRGGTIRDFCNDLYFQGGDTLAWIIRGVSPALAAKGELFFRFRVGERFARVGLQRHDRWPGAGKLGGFSLLGSILEDWFRSREQWQRPLGTTRQKDWDLPLELWLMGPFQEGKGKKRLARVVLRIWPGLPG